MPESLATFLSFWVVMTLEKSAALATVPSLALTVTTRGTGLLRVTTGGDGAKAQAVDVNQEQLILQSTVQEFDTDW